MSVNAETPKGVFVSASEAARLLKDGARVLDARGTSARPPFLPGAVVTGWQEVRDGLLRVGRLQPEAEARAHYENKGVHKDRPLLIYGAAHEGWGEEGRVWWDVTLLGHSRAYLLDGGIKAWAELGGRTASVPSGPRPGSFRSSRVSGHLRADYAEVLTLSGLPTVQILDVRSRKEYDGATPFMSARGGHVPGARHLFWKALLDGRGQLRPKNELTAVLAEAGVVPGKTVVAYCTGGVRSGFVVAVLSHIGFDARNYDASWWDWASRAELPVE